MTATKDPASTRLTVKHINAEIQLTINRLANLCECRETTAALNCLEQASFWVTVAANRWGVKPIKELEDGGRAQEITEAQIFAPALRVVQPGDRAAE